MDSRSNLPIDIVNCILLELPVKSLLRFKITCKSWCCTIDDPNFIKSHLHKSSDINRQKFLFVNVGGFLNPECRGGVDQYKIWSTDASISSDSKVVCLPNIPGFGRDPYFEVLSSSTGLLFIMSCNGSMALWNPAVQKYKLIPDSLLIEYKKPWTPWISSPIFGFAYDFVAEDYKVVRLHVKKIVENPCYIVEIYSVKNQSWRTIHNILRVTALRGEYTEPVSLNGVIHGTGYQGEKRLIISFHLADEKFIVTPVPRKYGEKLALHAWGDRLSVLATVGKEISVWSLEKDRKTACLTWNYITKFPTLRSLMGNPNDLESSLDIIVCVKENGNILWRSYDNGQFIEYNVQKNEYVEYSLTGLTSFMWYKTLYVESLASLKIPWD